MNTGDASYIKQLNRSILLEEIIKNMSLSRSDLARITGLNKATVSSQVNDFIQEHIVIEKNIGESITRGRKPILLEINGRAGYSIGVDIDEHQMNILFTDLKGAPIKKIKLKISNDNLDHVTKQLIESLKPYLADLDQTYKPIGLVGVGVGIHGIVNNENEIIFTPKHQWSNINIKHSLEASLQTQVVVDNNANLSVFAEQVYDEHIADLFCITLYSGIGLGMIHKNEIYHGYQGFAGEIGHMIIESQGLPCPCGNKGCWELYAAEKALVDQLHKKTSIGGAIDLVSLLNQEGAVPVIDTYLDYLAIGLNNIINIFNPEKIVLNGAIINENSPFITEIEYKLKSKMNNYRDIRASKLGSDSAALGGAALAIKNFLGLQAINYVGYDYTKSSLIAK